MIDKSISVCPRCGKEFECGAKSGSATCWCFSFPHIISPDEGKECLCPKCLEEKILQRKHLPEITQTEH